MFEFHLPKELKNRRVKTSFKEDIELHEILLDKLAKKKEEELGISEKKIEVPLSQKFLQGFLLIFLILIFTLFVKTFQLQVIEHKELLALAESNKFKIYQIRAERGIIYDRFGNQLVFNIPSFDLVLDKRNFPQAEDEKIKVLKEVSGILKKNINEIKNEIEKSESPEVVISQNLPHQTLIILETKLSEFSGFQIERNWIRDYQEGEIFSHLIGYTGKITTKELKADSENYSISDRIGREGIEKFYEKILRKNPGKLRLERDALGNIISKEIISLPESGKSLVLWLDSDLQRKIKEELGKQLQILGTKKATAIALDPKTGGVLALVSLPSFDNNLFEKGGDIETLKKILEDPEKPLFNRAISGRYLVGSTIKPLVALAALEEKIISPEKQIYAGGFIEIPHQYHPEIVYTFKDWKVHGWTDMRKAIAQSVNVYFYTIGGGYGDQKGLGPTKIKEYLELFGWGEKTGIDLPGEAKGFIPDKEWKKRTFGENWWDGDTYYLSIGQQYLQITPLEVVASFLPIANGGRLFQPQVVKSIVDSQKNLIEEFEPKIIRGNFIDPKNLQIVREGMRQAVTVGSASSYLAQLPVSAAAKTGTAQTGKKDKYGNELFHNWVTVFAPYEDPQIVLTIMIEDVPQIMVATLPVAKNILEWYFSPH